MEYSIESTIEKIKLQESDLENKLRERRTYEETLISLKRDIRLTLSQATKHKQDYLKATSRVDALSARVSLEKINRKALTEQLDASVKELQSLKKECEQGITSVWDVRFSLSEAVQNVSDECDIWPLFLKPKHVELTQYQKQPNHDNIEISEETHVEDQKIPALKDRLKKLLNERDLLSCEPDSGEEFIRIKNALRYSAEMTSSLNKTL